MEVVGEAEDGDGGAGCERGGGIFFVCVSEGRTRQTGQEVRSLSRLAEDAQEFLVRTGDEGRCVNRAEAVEVVAVDLRAGNLMP